MSSNRFSGLFFDSDSDGETERMNVKGNRDSGRSPPQQRRVQKNPDNKHIDVFGNGSGKNNNKYHQESRVGNGKFPFREFGKDKFRENAKKKQLTDRVSAIFGDSFKKANPDPTDKQVFPELGGSKRMTNAKQENGWASMVKKTKQTSAKIAEKEDKNKSNGDEDGFTTVTRKKRPIRKADRLATHPQARQIKESEIIVPDDAKVQFNADNDDWSSYWVNFRSIPAC